MNQNRFPQKSVYTAGIIFLIIILFFVYHQYRDQIDKQEDSPVNKLSSPLNQPNRDQMTKAYSYAISAYIQSAGNDLKADADTLFIGKRPDFPDIKLPEMILNKKIHLLSEREVKEKLAYRKSLVYLNVIGWVDPDRSEFMIVTFFDNFKPQHNCHINFNNDFNKDLFELDTLYYDYSYSHHK